MVDFKYNKPEILAKNVLESSGIDIPTEIPISDIILGNGAFYSEKPLKNKDGEIVSLGECSIITVNSEIAFETRRRFAAAHELGHFKMHRDIKPVFSDTELHLLCWYQGGEHEMEANTFAAEFLMPSEIFYKSCFISKKFGPNVINHLAEKFQVSKTATILRFAKRGNHPVMVVCCKDNRMKWWKKSNDFRPFLEFEQDKHPPTGSVAYEFFTTGKVYFGDVAKQELWKSDWFQMREDECDTKFYEYCLYAKSYNYTLSIIWED